MGVSGTSGQLRTRCCDSGEGAALSGAVVEDISECYRVLELEPGATLEDVKHSYRELVKVWHPDRFANDPNLQKRAQEKLKQINLAYERICSGEGTGPRSQGTASGAPSAPSPPRAEQPEGPFGSGSGYEPRDARQPETNRQPPQPRRRNSRRSLASLAVTVILIAVVRAVITAVHQPERRAADYAAPFSQPSPANWVAEPSPAQPQPAPVVAADASGTQHEKTVDVASAGSREPHFPTSTEPDRDYFTVGSTKDEVLAVQGTPSQFSDSSFTYGASTVHFKTGRVVSWYDGYPKLKVKLSPSSKVAVADFFTVGSSKDEVLAVQGTPSQFSDSSFTYGASTVQFKNGKVVSWYDGYPKLRVRLSAKPAE